MEYYAAYFFTFQCNCKQTADGILRDARATATDLRASLSVRGRVWSVQVMQEHARVIRHNYHRRRYLSSFTNYLIYL